MITLSHDTSDTYASYLNISSEFYSLQLDTLHLLSVGRYVKSSKLGRTFSILILYIQYDHVTFLFFFGRIITLSRDISGSSYLHISEFLIHLAGHLFYCPIKVGLVNPLGPLTYDIITIITDVNTTSCKGQVYHLIVLSSYAKTKWTTRNADVITLCCHPFLALVAVACGDGMLQVWTYEIKLLLISSSCVELTAKPTAIVWHPKR